MIRRLLLSFALLALGIASAKTYTVTFLQPATIGHTELRPGDYKVEVLEQKVVLSAGKLKIESPVKVETVGDRYRNTSVRCDNADGKMRVQEIRLGGTNTKLVLTESGV